MEENDSCSLKATAFLLRPEIIKIIIFGTTYYKNISRKISWQATNNMIEYIR